MKQIKPILHCIYTQSEKTLAQLLEESFQCYLLQMLTVPNPSIRQDKR